VQIGCATRLVLDYPPRKLEAHCYLLFGRVGTQQALTQRD
jgi:hypothetical protein